MGTLATNDTNNQNSEIYLSLGLEDLGKKVMGTPRVLALLSALLERSVQKNERLLEKTQVKDILSVFHGVRAPTLSIRQYIDRIFKYSACSPSCFVVAHIYVDRFLRSSDVHLTSLNVHRLLITSVMVAAKFFDDAFFNNAYYARVGGVSTTELNRLEMKFLFSLDFQLYVSVETFQHYCFLLEKEDAEAPKIERSIETCRVKEYWSTKDDSTCTAPVAR